MTMEKTGNETKSAATEKAPKAENKATVPDKNAAQAYGAGVVPFTSIKFVLMTEKSVQGIEAQNRMVFIVDRKATKGSIAKEITATFNTPVKSVRTMFDQEGRKRAFVAFKNAGAAGEVAIKLGVI
ncbi:MAG: 50S ribosomal protein L23 [Candidatus Aenigmarchaeota archaeon]|nr:50S ribosomal protein L23 [Candidatus Aenigmarchaeota archaeon]